MERFERDREREGPGSLGCELRCVLWGEGMCQKVVSRCCSGGRVELELGRAVIRGIDV